MISKTPYQPPPSYSEATGDAQNTKTEASSALRIDYGEDAIMTACRNNDLDYFEQLVCSKEQKKKIHYFYECKDPDSEYNEDNISVLHLACLTNKPKVAELLLKASAAPDIKTPTGITPIILACSDNNGNSELVELLANWLFPSCLDINQCSQVRSKNGNVEGLTLLQYACRSQNAGAVEILLARGANPDLSGSTGRKPINILTANREVDDNIIRLLHNAGADVDVRERGLTPLHKLCSNGNNNKNAVLALLAAGADVNAQGDKGETPLILACQNNHTLALLLLANSEFVDPGCMDQRGWQPIHYAAEKGHSELVALLVEKGVEVDATLGGITALHLAVSCNHEETVNILLDLGADASIRGHYPLSFSRMCKLTTYALCGPVLTCGVWFYGLAIASDQDNARPRPLRVGTRYCQTCCPASKSLTPLDLAEDGLRERMESRIAAHNRLSESTSQHGGIIEKQPLGLGSAPTDG